ncbi:hypothetical protein M5F04_11710 [Acinetobacter sp. ANC 7200]|uniref:hypothetical protein n=1 Tax=Acinetobacter amyesii TaxID=2942470 RepID=UPI0020C17D87|nr:hypothetical protein [Acinetobacter amyesii]MCL6245199.1 hypothetical protein [Acinetobacter amyesii]
MTFYIGGHSNGEKVDQDYLDRKEPSIPKSFGLTTGFRKTEIYVRKHVTFQGETKTVYLLRGMNATDLRDEILSKWDWIHQVDGYFLE